MAQNQMSPAALAPARGSATVVGGFDEELPHVSVITNGSRATMFRWDPTEKAWEEYDRLTSVEMFVDRDGNHVYRGTSDNLKNIVGTDDNQVDWVVAIEGCQDCP